jgi:hypothetical protein
MAITSRGPNCDRHLAVERQNQRRHDRKPATHPEETGALIRMCGNAFAYFTAIIFVLFFRRRIGDSWVGPG